MKIKFINHSSLLIETDSESILCDPWYEGTAFANGWRLLLDNAIDINEINFDKLWISHEHPDHFSVSTLKSLKKKKPVLYQKTKDRKVKQFLESQGHRVIEIDSNETYKKGSTEISCIVTEGYDSCLLIDNGDLKFLNVNDSQLDKEAEIKKITKYTPVDLISIQFHYANWAGNKGDEIIPEFKRQNAVNRIKKICEVCETCDVILFASFIYYAHEENFYWNKSFSYIERTIRELEQAGLNVILMKPDQEIQLNSSREYKLTSKNNDNSLNYWKEKHQNIRVTEFTKTHDIELIEKLYGDYFDRIKKENNIEKFKDSFLKDFSLEVFINDLNLKIKLGLYKKKFIKEEATSIGNADVSVSSEAMVMLFQNNFSLGSITISSRIQFNYNNVYKFYFFFLIPYRNNLGIFLENSISDELQFGKFRSNGVMRPIFEFHKKAEENFDKFNQQLLTL